MSKSKPLESVKIDMDDVQVYALHSTKNPPHMITNWLSLSSQLTVDGLQAFRAALNSPSISDSAEDLKKLKDEHLRGLLEDLEKLSKRQEISAREGGKFPKFNPDFYNEVSKPEQDRSPEFKEFLKKYSELTAGQHSIEKISAQMLIDLAKPEANIGDLRKDLDGHLKSYKQNYAAQTAKDIGVRELILLKDSSGQTKAITMDELASSKDLTGEQRDFIKSAWQQGSFGAGWFTASTFQYNNEKGKMTAFAQNALLIDISEIGKVQVTNQVMSNWKSDIDQDKIFGPRATGTLLIDISNLKGDEFIPGCASSKPKIEVVVSKHDKDFDFIPDKLKKTSSPTLDNVTAKVSADFENGYYNTAKASDEKLAKMAFVKISEDDPLRYKIKIEKFKSKESDPVKIEEFASQQIDKFSKKQTAVLDHVEKDRIKAGLIAILEPLCKDDQERKALKDNAGKLVRDCANKAGKDMSWGQAWNNFVDKAKNIVSQLMGKQTEVEKLVSKHPEAVEALKKNMTPPQAARVNPSTEVKNLVKKDTSLRR